MGGKKAKHKTTVQNEIIKMHIPPVTYVQKDEFSN